MHCQDCNNQLKSKNTKRCQPCYLKILSQRNRDEAPERMRKNNPMANLETRQKMKDTLKIIGHKPCVQGGNGKPLPKAQQILLSALKWRSEFAVAVGRGRGCGWPTCYKIDIANPELKIGIEVDGGSHSSIERRKQDLKKEEFLRSIGWKILRFTNDKIIFQLDACLKEIHES